jgi:hypothetical protein
MRDMLEIQEEKRNVLIAKGIEKLLHPVSNLCHKDANLAGIYSGVLGILKSLEKIHINRVKEILIKALNSEQIPLH